MNVKEMFKQLKKIGLEKKEKKAIRDELILFMRKNPASFGLEVRKLGYSGRGLFKPFVVAFASVLLVVTSVSFAAEGSLPGDTLYTVKVSVNERLADWVSVTEKADVKWEARVAERRLEEVQKMLALEDEPQAARSIGVAVDIAEPDFTEDGEFGVVALRALPEPALETEILENREINKTVATPEFKDIKIEAARELILRAKENISSGSYERARELSRRARESAEEARLLIKTRRAEVELKEGF